MRTATAGIDFVHFDPATDSHYIQETIGSGLGWIDYDNDGWPDLFCVQDGPVRPQPGGARPTNKLYRNNRDGTFSDVTAKAGLARAGFGQGCAVGDFDNDGFDDLVVTYLGEIVLYRNNGNGTFTDITSESGIANVPPAPGLGVVMTDFDGDGRLDIYAANDLKPQYLFHNQGNGRFVEKGVFSGCGLGPGGQPVSGMGVEAGDIDGTGRPSLFVTNFHNQPSVLYRNRGGLRFQECGTEAGLGFPHINRLGFGTVFLDANLDGRLDVVTANGHIHRNAEEVYRAPYAQQAQLFVGEGAGKFRDASDRAGGYFREKRVGRGLAWADFDNDGKPDLAFSNCGQPPALLHNRMPGAGAWLGLELIGDGKTSNRNAIGARVEVEYEGGKQTRFVNGGGSYLSAGERRVLVGLGGASGARRVVVRWPSGREQAFADVPARRWWRLSEGKEQPEIVAR